MHYQGAKPLCFFAQHAGCPGIHGHGLLGFGFGAIDRGMGRRIDDDLRTRLANHGAQGVRLGKVALRPLERDQFAQRRQGALQLETNLAVLARQQNAHQLTSY